MHVPPSLTDARQLRALSLKAEQSGYIWPQATAHLVIHSAAGDGLKWTVNVIDFDSPVIMPGTRIKQWGWAWVALSITVGLHVADEAANGFLPLYNSIVQTIRESYPWIPLPTFTFSVWLGGLIVGVIALLFMSPMVFAGNLLFRPVSYILGVLMTLNALTHIGGSIYFGALVPGALSSPVLLLSAVALLTTTYRVHHSASGDGGNV